ncbi:hypothetical protein CLOSTASPAR_00221 [[Clostridium] asparagiforme DSM 15981]|uniref:Uncharacterized protein n=1 Tax=[Clostridium] asparagiforme DSM 15981 TaxID=518636 RepID=C0CTC3_9FIRM|nr:hypothetical protein CLOSTASPAR_00221 [[Clostridium] asparagiforme DSM 15981]
MERRAGHQGMIMQNACDYSLIFFALPEIHRALWESDRIFYRG